MKDTGGEIRGYMITVMYESFGHTWQHTSVIPALVRRRQGGVIDSRQAGLHETNDHFKNNLAEPYIRHHLS